MWCYRCCVTRCASLVRCIELHTHPLTSLESSKYTLAPCMCVSISRYFLNQLLSFFSLSTALLFRFSIVWFQILMEKYSLFAYVSRCILNFAFTLFSMCGCVFKLLSIDSFSKFNEFLGFLFNLFVCWYWKVFQIVTNISVLAWV